MRTCDSKYSEERDRGDTTERVGRDAVLSKDGQNFSKNEKMNEVFRKGLR